SERIPIPGKTWKPFPKRSSDGCRNAPPKPSKLCDNKSWRPQSQKPEKVRTRLSNRPRQSVWVRNALSLYTSPSIVKACRWDWLTSAPPSRICTDLAERPECIWKRVGKTGRGNWVGRKEAVVEIRTKLNGAWREDEVEPRLLLVHYLREVAGLTGTHVGCETS